MKTETSCNYISDMKTIIKDVFSSARIYTLTHAQLLNSLRQKVYSHPKYRALPRWSQSHLAGYVDAQFEHMYTALEWRVNLNGWYILSKDVPKGEWPNVTDGALFYTGTNKFYSDLEEN